MEKQLNTLKSDRGDCLEHLVVVGVRLVGLEQLMNLMEDQWPTVTRGFHCPLRQANKLVWRDL